MNKPEQGNSEYDAEHEYWVAQRLAKNPKLAREYLKIMLEDADTISNEQTLLRALRQVAKAQGISKVAEAAGIRRESLSRALSDKGNPRIDTLLSIMRAMGLQLTVKPISA
jgi:probable addiction module antidote protein